MAKNGRENWTGWCGLDPYDRDKLFIALRAAHVPVFKGGDMVLANSVDFAMLADIMHSCNIHHGEGFKAVAMSDDEIAEMEKALTEDKDTTFSKHEEDIRAVAPQDMGPEVE